MELARVRSNDRAMNTTSSNDPLGYVDELREALDWPQVRPLFPPAPDSGGDTDAVTPELPRWRAAEETAKQCADLVAEPAPSSRPLASASSMGSNFPWILLQGFRVRFRRSF